MVLQLLLYLLIAMLAKLWYNDLIVGRERPNGHSYRDCGAIISGERVKDIC